MKNIQLLANRFENNDLLRQAGVQKIYDGWYTVLYNGITVDGSNVVSAKRNKSGKIKY